MSRSGYDDDCEGWALIRWRGAVTSAIRGKRGQAFLSELVQALDSLPEPRLTHDALRDSQTGEYCALGAVARSRGLDVASLDPEDREAVAAAFGISTALAAEIMYENDSYWQYPTDKNSDARRWQYMRQWASSLMKGAKDAEGAK